MDEPDKFKDEFILLVFLFYFCLFKCGGTQLARVVKLYKYPLKICNYANEDYLLCLCLCLDTR